MASIDWIESRVSATDCLSKAISGLLAQSSRVES